MKFFSRFLSEAEESKVADQARRKGLKSDGHGGWLDRTGKYVAKTEKGKLRFFGTRGPGQDDQPAARKPAAAQPTAQKKVQSPVAIMAKKRADDDLAGAPLQKKEEEGGEEKGDNPITIAFGRFNPPTIGHGKLLDAAKKASAGGEMKIYPSRSQDEKKNPLDPDMKVSYMKKLFPDYKENIINDSEMKTIFDVLTTANEDGFRNVNIIVGADRQAEFENLATKYNGDLYDFDTIRVISAGVRDADAEGVEGMSASKMRKAVADDDFAAFKRGLPKGTKDADTQALFDAVRTGMKVKKGSTTKKKSDAEVRTARYKEDEKGRKAAEKKRLPQHLDTAVDKALKKHGTVSKHDEEVDLWMVAPKLDPRGLRENYFRKNIFNIGDMVESLTTGLVGKILRRGTNYLISVTENNVMFKSWTHDLAEYSEKKLDSKYLPDGKPNTLVGTGGYLKYAMSMTPDSGPTEKKEKKKMNIKEFINKYKLRK